MCVCVCAQASMDKILPSAPAQADSKHVRLDLQASDKVWVLLNPLPIQGKIQQQTTVQTF